MLQRVSFFKPRIEHPMSKNEIGGGGATERPPNTECVILPNTVHHNDVETMAVCAQPRHEAGRIAIAAGRWAHCVDFKWTTFNPRRVRRIEGQYLYFVAAGRVYRPELF